MPLNFKIGATADCKINGEPARVTWRNQHTLVIEPDDARQIFHIETDDQERCFFCGDPGAKQASIDWCPDGVMVSQDDTFDPIGDAADRVIDKLGKKSGA
jgi:hypothetical protein